MKTQISIHLRIITFFTLLFFSYNNSFAQQEFYIIENFVTSKNDTIENCKIGFQTFGEIISDSSNVIIYPTWFGGTSEHLKVLIKPERFIDTSKYFVIAIDALGNGVSSSPSNHEEFPSISILDMVNSQYKLLTNHFKLSTIFGAIGGSMGGMQIFEWVASYPGFISKAVSYVSTPQPTSNDLLNWNLRAEIYSSYTKLNASEKQIQKTLNILNALTARTPDYIVDKISYDEFEKYMLDFDAAPNNTFTSDNYNCQVQAMLQHNIFREQETLDKSFESTEMMFIVSETDHLVNPKNTIELAEKYNHQIHILKNNCGHLAISCEIDYCSELIRIFFDK